jgi:GTP cyclohydrolase I
VITVENVPWREDVWCMDVPKHHNFFANGICVHNCEHHLLPFGGVAHVAYIPASFISAAPGPCQLRDQVTFRLLGLSKTARLVDAFARRLQLQERITTQVADALMAGVQALGVGVVLEAEHHCLACRGARKPGVKMVTSALRGAFREKPEVRAEFLSLVHNGR